MHPIGVTRNVFDSRSRFAGHFKSGRTIGALRNVFDGRNRFAEQILIQRGIFDAVQRKSFRTVNAGGATSARFFAAFVTAARKVIRRVEFKPDFDDFGFRFVDERRDDFNLAVRAD